MKNQLIDIFFQVIDKECRPVTYQMDPRFKPSILGSSCQRKIFYSYNCIVEDFGASRKGKLTMEMGNKIHELLGDVFRKSGILVDFVKPDGQPMIGKYSHKPDYEFPLKDKELQLSLKIDAIFKIDGKIWIGEYKSIKFDDWFKLTKPKDEHMIQATIYHFIFTDAIQHGLFEYIPALSGIRQVEGIKFLYINKDDTQWKQTGEGILKEFEVMANDDLFIKVIEKMESIKEYTKMKMLPPKADDYCFSCNFRGKCGRNETGLR